MISYEMKWNDYIVRNDMTIYSETCHDIDLIWYENYSIWYDMVWYDMIWNDMIWYDTTYLLTDMINDRKQVQYIE
jgi:hypothetical protein